MTDERRRPQGNRWVMIAACVLCPLYGIAASMVFVLSGTFGTFGEMPWRDVALIVISVISSLALTYISLLLVTYVQHEPRSLGDPETLEWHVLIPCRDEESVVAETVSAARGSFPNMHVWVIDDASEDSTARVVRGLQDFDDRVHLISRRLPDARTGKGDALNTAYRRVSEFVGDDPERRNRTIVGVLDADGYLSDNTLDILAGNDAFGEAAVGAVQLEVWMKNRQDRQPRPMSGRLKNAMGRLLVRLQDVEFRTSNSAMQLVRLRTRTVGMGGNGQFTRLSVLDELTVESAQPWGRKLSEDYELGLNILALGHRTHYVRGAHVSQEALPYLRRLLTQRTRWAQGLLECASLLPKLRRSHSLPVIGLVEIQYVMMQAWLTMINLVVVPTLVILAIVENSAVFWQDASVWITVLAAVVFLVVPYAMWGPLYRAALRKDHERLGVLGAAGLGLTYLGYVYLTYLYYPRAIGRMLTGRNSWAKTLRNADDLRALEQLAPELVSTAVPLLDRDVLEELVADLDGHQDSAVELVSTFAVVWPRRSANLREAVAAEHPMRASDAIASIRVSAQMLGARRLAETATTVSSFIAAEDFASARNALATVDQVGSDTVEHIRSEFVRA